MKYENDTQIMTGWFINRISRGFSLTSKETSPENHLKVITLF